MSQIWFAFHRIRVTNVSFYRTTYHNIIMSVHATATDLSVTSVLSSYAKLAYVP